MKSICFFFILFFSIAASAQYQVTFKIQKPATHNTDAVYIAGSFNNWNPEDASYRSTNGSDIILRLPAGSYEYKFTRGGWNKVEATFNGNGVANRSFTLTHDTTINVSISGWNDDFKHEEFKRRHTASANVKIIDTAFKIPQLNRTRRIWIYLPADYATSKKRFPVWYMHDGQNLFDEYTSGFGEWGVDELLDSLFKQGKKESIIVGIDNSATRRFNEYNPYAIKNYGNGEGDAYVDFLVQTLKPFIDEHYRTLPDKKNTFISGSSMGGLISMYAVVKYPNVFGGAGIFSPSFWAAPALDSAIKVAAPKINSRLFFYVGGSEGEGMVPDMQRIEQGINSLTRSTTTEIVDPAAKHNEAAWHKYFAQVYLWIMQ